MKGVHNIKKLSERRKELRKNATFEENLLWQRLRDTQLGVKFKRQHSIGGYILDFYCSKKKLIVEVDGEIHNTFEAREWDKIRDKFFTDLDYKVLRIWNREVKENIDDVLQKIKESLR